MLRLYDVAQLKLLALNQLAGFYSIYGAFLAGAAFNSGHTTVFSVGDITKKQNKKKKPCCLYTQNAPLLRWS